MSALPSAGAKRGHYCHLQDDFNCNLFYASSGEAWNPVDLLKVDMPEHQRVNAVKRTIRILETQGLKSKLTALRILGSASKIPSIPRLVSFTLFSPLSYLEIFHTDVLLLLFLLQLPDCNPILQKKEFFFLHYRQKAFFKPFALRLVFLRQKGRRKKRPFCRLVKQG